MSRSRDCTYLVEFEILFSDQMSETVSTEKCNFCSKLEKEIVVCSSLEKKVSGLDLLKQLPPGIAIQPSRTSHPKKVETELKKNLGVVIIQDGKTTIPLPNRRPQQVKPQQGRPQQVRPQQGRSQQVRAQQVPRKRIIENIPVMTAADLSDEDLNRIQVFNLSIYCWKFLENNKIWFLKHLHLLIFTYISEPI